MRYFDVSHYLYAAMAMAFTVFCVLPGIFFSTSLLPAGPASTVVVIAVIATAPLLLALVAVGLQIRDFSVLRRVQVVRYEFDRHVLRRYERPVRFSVRHRPVVGAEREHWNVDVKKVRCITKDIRFPGGSRIQLWDADPILQMNFGDGSVGPSNRRAALIAGVDLRDLDSTPDVRAALIAFVGQRRIKTDLDLAIGR